MNFFIGIFLQALYLPNITVVNTEDLGERFLRSVFLILHFQSLGTMNQFPFKSRVGSETWLKHLTEVSNYDQFICNIFGWDTVKIGVIRAKAQFSVRIQTDGLFKNFFHTLGIVNLLLMKCRQGLSSYAKTPHCFASLRICVCLNRTKALVGIEY